MRTSLYASVVCAVSVLSTSAFAVPLGPNVPKVTVVSTDKLTASTKFTAAAAKLKNPAFSVTKTYKTASGGTITGQQYLDLVNQLQAAAEKGGCSLGSGKACNFVASEAKLTTAQLTKTAALASYKIAPKKVTVTALGGKMEKKAKAPLGFSWNNEWGSQSTGAVYVGAEFGDDGSSSTSSCAGSAYAGVYLFNNKKEVVRLEGEAGSSGSTFSASAELFVLGDSVWSKNASFSASKSFEKSFSVSKSLSYWGLVTVNLSAKATGAAYITGAISGTAKTGEYTCSLGVTPGVKASVTATAEVALLGYGHLSAASVGVEADVTLADLSIPVVASASAKTSSGVVTFTESLSVDLNMNYLKGSLDAYFKTSIPLDGEKIWDWDADKFTFTILEWDGKSYNASLYKRTQTQTL